MSEQRRIDSEPLGEPPAAGSSVEAPPAAPSSSDAPPRPDDPDPPASTGDPSFGKYRFIATLGQGGMADVYLAVAVGPVGFSKLQVIKRLKPLLSGDPELRAMFLDEARLAARLNHRNVVQTNEIGLAENQYFIAMEYLDGQPLHRVLNQSEKINKPLSLAVQIRILCDVLTGLHYAHELTDYDGGKLGVVHRDISPQNVFITYDGQVKIVDFGIAKASRRTVETQVGVIKGKVAYMAAEQAFATSDVDRRADLFAVGVMLWEAVAERRLWQGMNDMEIIARMMQDVPRVRSVKPGVLPELSSICDRALARDPDQRFPTAAAFRAELEPILDRIAQTKVTPEEIGAIVSDLFKDQRAELKAVIDRQLSFLQDEAPDTLPRPDRRHAPLPRIALDTVPPSTPAPPSDDLPTRREVLEVRRSDRPASMSQVAAASQRPLEATPAHGTATPAHGTLSAVLTRPEGRGRAIPLIAVAALALAAVGGGAWFLGRGSKAEVTQPAPPASTEGKSAAPPPTQVARAPSSSPTVVPVALAEGSTIEAKISAIPKEAKIILDGAQLPKNPFAGKMVKDGAVHRIQFESTGCIAQSRIVVFDKDFKVDVVLLPKPKSGSGVPGSGLQSKPDPYGGHN